MDNSIIPDDAVFEEAQHTPHDAIVKPEYRSAIHLDGNSRKGEVVEYLTFDDADGKFFHEIKQNIEPTLRDVAQRHLSEGRDVGKGKSGEWYHAARVDSVVLVAWLNQRGLQMKDFKGEIIKQFLNDSENKPFRIWGGQL